jgi:hypothetical protein
LQGQGEFCLRVKTKKPAIEVMKNKPTKKSFRTKKRFATAGACLGVIVGGTLGAHCQTNNVSDSDKINQLAAQNQLLQQRLDSLEAEVQKEGLAPSGGPTKAVVSALDQITISGFAQASYFFNTQRPSSGQNDTYLWNTKDNSFSLNKFKLTIASAPVATDKWDAGFKASLMFGDDAPDLNSPGANGIGGSNTSFNDLREAYVEINVPIGTGLDIKAGELISLLNWESGDGGAANPNFSQGYQWWYTGNGPSAGVQGTYNFTDKIGLTVRVDNGLYQGPVDNNQGKAFSGSINLKPTDKLWVNLIGWYDSQPDDNNTSGMSSIGGYQFTKAFGTGYEVDYFHYAAPGNSTDLWSVGGWAWYNFTSKVGVAFRADYVSQDSGVLGPAVRPGAGLETAFAPDGGSLGSLTTTLNLTPLPYIKIQPEIRYDYTSYSGGLNGKAYQLIVGCGVSYLF